MKNTGIFNNLNKKLYIARKVDPTLHNNHKIVTYDTPFYLGKVNYQPLSNEDLYAYMSTYGETKNKLVKLLLDIKHRGKFKEFDLAYLYSATPENEEVNGENANYVVKTYIEQNTKILVIFEELVKEGM